MDEDCKLLFISKILFCRKILCLSSFSSFNYFNIKIAQLQKKAIVNQVITNEAQNKIFLKTTVCILREIILFILKKDKYYMFFVYFSGKHFSKL